jgi:hypothetical protein
LQKPEGFPAGMGKTGIMAGASSLFALKSGKFPVIGRTGQKDSGTKIIIRKNWILKNFTKVYNDKA